MKFSIIIPARNEEEIIQESIESILKQSYQNFEIIISNDGSTDKTKKIVEDLIKKDKRIKILNRDKGHSASFARNKGAEIAKGEILIFLDADTYLSENTLEEIYKNYEKADAFTINCQPINKTWMSKILSAFFVPINLEKKEYDKNSPDKPMFFCISRKAYKKIGGYDEEIFYYEDEDFAERFYEKDLRTFVVNKPVQYFELPTTFSEFLRQCKWIGKGTNTIKKDKKRRKHKFLWFFKTIFLLIPLVFFWNIKLLIGVFLATFLFSFLQLLRRNKQFILSLIAMPFLYLKTFYVTFNLIRFWK